MNNLEQEVHDVMQRSVQALTVDQVTQEIAERIKDEIRSILNALVKKGALRSARGGGGHPTVYKAPGFKRRLRTRCGPKDEETAREIKRISGLA
jgi:predicted transcriptional regulator